MTAAKNMRTGGVNQAWPVSWTFGLPRVSDREITVRMVFKPLTRYRKMKGENGNKNLKGGQGQVRIIGKVNSSVSSDKTSLRLNTTMNPITQRPARMDEMIMASVAIPMSPVMPNTSIPLSSEPR